MTRATLATGIVGGIGGANPLVLREGDSPRVLTEALAQFKEALARPPPQFATSVYPGLSHTVAELRRLNPRGRFRCGATPDGKATIEVKSLLDACEVGPDLWRRFEPAPEGSPEEGTLTAPYAELAAPWWKRQLEAQRAEIREFIRPPGEFTHDARRSQSRTSTAPRASGRGTGASASTASSPAAPCATAATRRATPRSTPRPTSPGCGPSS